MKTALFLFLLFSAFVGPLLLAFPPSTKRAMRSSLPVSEALTFPQKFSRARRLLLVAVAYGLSLVGILGMAIVVFGVALRPTPSALALLVWSYAWSCHLIMCVGWINNKRVSRVVPLSGATAGVASLLIVPAGLISPSSSIAAASLFTVLQGALFQALLVSPSVLLAAFLVWFHLSSNPNGASS